MVLCNKSGVPVAGIAEAAMRWFGGLPVEKTVCREEDPWTAEQIQKAVGVYRSGEGGVIEISEKDGKPCVAIGGKELPTRAVAPNLLEVTASAFGPSLIQTIETEERGVYCIRHGARLVPKE